VRDRVFAALVAAVAAAAFLPALSFGFVYDDHRFLAENDNLTGASVVWRAFADPACQTADATYAGLWRPLRTLSFALDRALFGQRAWGPHAVNVVLHSAAAAALFALLRRIGAGVTAACAGAVLYALHPVQVECVAWVSSRGDLLAAALLFSSTALDLSGSRRWALALGAAALFAKEQAVV
jgi:hypothetical protein